MDKHLPPAIFSVSSDEKNEKIFEKLKTLDVKMEKLKELEIKIDTLEKLKNNDLKSLELKIETLEKLKELEVKMENLEKLKNNELKNLDVKIESKNNEIKELEVKIENLEKLKNNEMKELEVKIENLEKLNKNEDCLKLSSGGTVNGFLKVSGRINSRFGKGYSWQTDSIKTYNGNMIIDVGIHSDHKITTSSGFYILSDKRMKENIKEYSEKDENKLSKINSYEYNYIGQDEKQIGYIAQEILEIFPEAVSKKSEYIPSIYKNVKIVDYKYPFIELIGDFNEIEIKDKIKMFYKDQELECKFVEKNDNIYKFELDKKINIFDLDEIFVYGKKINDLLVVSYEKLIPFITNILKNHNNDINNIKKKYNII
jgi:hypothetical protein